MVKGESASSITPENGNMKSHDQVSQKPNLLIGTDVVGDDSVRILSRYATVFKSMAFDEKALLDLLPSTDVLLVFSWPRFLTRENLAKMCNLRFIQSILAGANHIPFSQLDRRMIVSSNAGAYSDEVAEYAWALLLSAAKGIVDFHNSVRSGQWNLRRTLDGKEVTILEEKTLGILGYGGIGSRVAKIGKGFGMSIQAFTRSPIKQNGVKSFQGEKGLFRVLSESDAVMISLPLTNSTNKIVGGQQLASMKKNGILVNIARGELVDEKALYKHLKMNPHFQYVTDVWWYREGKESLQTSYPFFDLPNFIGTPHVSGPSGLATGKPVRLAVENVIRFLRGLRPRNIVDPAEYLATDRQDY